MNEKVYLPEMSSFSLFLKERVRVGTKVFFMIKIGKKYILDSKHDKVNNAQIPYLTSSEYEEICSITYHGYEASIIENTYGILARSSRN